MHDDLSAFSGRKKPSYYCVKSKCFPRFYDNAQRFHVYRTKSGFSVCTNTFRNDLSNFRVKNRRFPFSFSAWKMESHFSVSQSLQASVILQQQQQYVTKEQRDQQSQRHRQENQHLSFWQQLRLTAALFGVESSTAFEQVYTYLR